jgi:nucleotide-binding universal stress UspA family protein
MRRDLHHRAVDGTEHRLDDGHGKDPDAMAYGMVVVGTDGSDSALGAVERAAEIAEGSGPLVLVVCACSAMTRREQAVAVAQLGDSRFDQVIGEEAAEAALATACKRAQDSGATRVEPRLVEGDAVHVLLQIAEERAADLIVVGNRGINTRLGRILGSVPSVVSQRSPCDVLIVHTVEGGKGD